MTDRENYGIIGETYGRLTIVRRSSRKGGNSPYFWCLCSCGNEKEVSVHHLRRGSTKSCGCLRQEVAKQNQKTQHLPQGEASLRTVYRRYQRSAREKGMLFELSLDDLRSLSLSKCYYCGQEPVDSYKTSLTCLGEHVGNGVDRVDNTVGYTRENSVPCCRKCNFMKGTFSEKDFLESVRRIYEFKFA